MGVKLEGALGGEMRYLGGYDVRAEMDGLSQGGWWHFYCRVVCTHWCVFRVCCWCKWDACCAVFRRMAKTSLLYAHVFLPTPSFVFPHMLHNQCQTGLVNLPFGNIYRLCRYDKQVPAVVHCEDVLRHRRRIPVPMQSTFRCLTIDHVRAEYSSYSSFFFPPPLPFLLLPRHSCWFAKANQSFRYRVGDPSLLGCSPSGRYLWFPRLCFLFDIRDG